MTPFGFERRKSALVLIMLIGLVMAACGGGSDSPEAAIRVEGETISTKTTDSMVNKLLKAEGIRPAVESGEITPSVVRKFVAEYLIRMAYLEHAAKELNIDVDTNEQETEAVAALPAEAFATRGWQAGDFRKALRAGRLSKAIANKLFPSVSIPDSDLRTYYDDNAEKLKHYWHAQARVAIFKEKGPAEAMRDPAAAGEAFETAARRLGAEVTGPLGELTPDARLGPPLLDAIGSLAPGQVSEAIGSGGAWFVLTVDSRVDTPAQTFEDVKPEMTELLAEIRRQDLFDRWLRKQLGRAKVTVNSKYGEWDAASAAVT